MKKGDVVVVVDGYRDHDWTGAGLNDLVEETLRATRTGVVRCEFINSVHDALLYTVSFSNGDSWVVPESVLVVLNADTYMAL